MGYRKDALHLDSLMHQTTSIIAKAPITPTNIVAVKRKLKGRIHNPELQYEVPDQTFVKARRPLANFELKPRSYTEKLLVAKQKEMITHMDMLYKLGSSDMHEESKKIYPLPNKKLVDYAYTLIQEKGEKSKPQKVKADQATALFKENFKRLNLKYKIKRLPMVNSCYVSPRDKLLALKKKARFSKSFLNRLVAHEIGVHIFRYENGGEHKLHIFQDGVAGYLATEEGLAAYNESRLGVSKLSTLKSYAGRVIAVHTAQENDFVTTYKEVRRFLNRTSAVQIALRAKRGLCDTSQPGGFTKDTVYLRGLFEVQEYIRKKGSLKKLFTGKIRTQDVAHLKKLSLRKPKYFDQNLFFLE